MLIERLRHLFLFDVFSRVKQVSPSASGNSASGGGIVPPSRIPPFSGPFYKSVSSSLIFVIKKYEKNSWNSGIVTGMSVSIFKIFVKFKTIIFAYFVI